MEKKNEKKQNSLVSGIVIIRLEDKYMDPNAATLEDVIKKHKLYEVSDVLQKFKIEKTSRLITSVSFGRIAELEEKAMKSDFPPLRSLNNSWKINALHFRNEKKDEDKMDTFIDELRQADGITSAYEYTPVSQPGTVIPGSGDLTTGIVPLQGYLNPADEGVDAKFAWACGYDGSAPAAAANPNTLLDVEQGWNLTHEDLVGKVPAGPEYGIMNPETVSETFPGGGPTLSINLNINHGTAVLGIIAAKDNDKGALGIAPNVDQIRLFSHYKSMITSTPETVHDAIAYAISVAMEGDILLVECQIGGVDTAIDSTGASYDSMLCWPVEFDRDVYSDHKINLALIQLAAGNGIIVIEPAGNGNDSFPTKHDLDTSRDIPLEDSGAIMVAACYECTKKNERLAYTSTGADGYITNYYTNYGSRVNCFASGFHVATCGYDDILEGVSPDYDINKQYHLKFGLTSSASAIIAGVALVVQGIAKEEWDRPLTPAQMRDLLSDPAYGTLSANSTVADPNADKIGIMPDLRKIIRDYFGVAPDVYMRDNFSDDGSVPSSGSVCQSPDILIQSSESTDPEADFIAGTNYDLFTTSSYVDKSTDNYIYVRHKNIGHRNLNNLTTTVYYSPASTLILPSAWIEIGKTPTAVVKQGMAAVSDVLVWNAADIPASGHYCFIAITGSFLDPAPAIPAAISDFPEFVSDNNNVAWRNFNIIPIPPPPLFAIYEFIICGFSMGPIPFKFQFKKSTIELLQLSLEVPDELAKLLSYETKGFKKTDKGDVVIPVNSKINLIFNNVVMPGNKKFKVRVKANFDSGKIPSNIINYGSLRIIQLFKDKFIG
ncbi:MAG: S8 family serine peptidase, partial [Bacteroidia bacterium]